jgi:hypothetical protein
VLSEARRWALATSAILVRHNLHDPALLGGMSASPAAEAESRELLDEDWDTRSTEGAREAIDGLLVDVDDPSELAWNLGRVAFIAGRAYLAGWLDEAAAWDACMTAARRVQASFESWDAFGEAYLEGREAWADEDDAAMRFVYRALVLEVAGPWSLPWSTPLT